MPTDFLDVYEEHVWDVYGFLAYRLGSHRDAEDLTQVTFERAFRSWSNYDERRSSARTWLLAIALNALRDDYRRRSARPDSRFSIEDVPASQLPQAAELEAHLGLSPELERALAQLNQREREVLALRFGGDMTGPEIADAMNLSLANVQQILSRSLRKLRQILAEDAEASDTSVGERASSGDA
jgi:RNA polymerase sigma-70 factor (ECF subfamily)